MNSHNGHATHGVSHGRRDDALADGPNELSRTDGALAAAAPAEPRTVQTTAGPGRKPRSRFSVARTARMCIALALITAALWWLVVPFFVPVTSQAVVNARMVQVRAPIDGAAVEIASTTSATGARGRTVAEGRQQPGGHVPPGRVGRPPQRAGRPARAPDSDLEGATQTRDECRASTQRFYNELVSSLKDSITEAEARYRGRPAPKSRPPTFGQRARGEARGRAGRRGQRAGRARAGETVAAKQVQRRPKPPAPAEEAAAAAEQGFLFERDAPSFEQRADELDAKIPQMQAEIKETDDKLAAADQELQDEQRRMDRLSEAAVASPVSGAVWKRNGEPGQAVKQQENLLEIADRGTIFVEAVCPRSHLSAITTGSRAVIRLTDGRVLNGHVRAVRTLGGADTEASFAINMPCPDMKQVRILIDFDAPASATPPSSAGTRAF